MVKKIKVSPYKYREGQGRATQYAYNGVAMQPITQAIVETLNELIEDCGCQQGDPNVKNHKPTLTKKGDKYYKVSDHPAN